MESYTVNAERGVLHVSEEKQPHETLTDKNNGLSSAQEVLYAEEFKKADKAGEKKEEQDGK